MATEFVVYADKEVIGVYDTIRKASVAAWYTYITHFTSRTSYMHFFISDDKKIPKPEFLPEVHIEKWVNNVHTLSWIVEIPYATLCSFAQKKIFCCRLFTWKYELSTFNRVPDDLWKKYMFVVRNY